MFSSPHLLPLRNFWGIAYSVKVFFYNLDLLFLLSSSFLALLCPTVFLSLIMPSVFTMSSYPRLSQQSTQQALLCHRLHTPSRGLVRMVLRKTEHRSLTVLKEKSSSQSVMQFSSCSGSPLISTLHFSSG